MGLIVRRSIRELSIVWEEGGDFGRVVRKMIMWEMNRTVGRRQVELWRGREMNRLLSEL